jgi:hypothetical protein
MTKTYRQHTIKGWQYTAVYNTHRNDKNIQTTYNQRLTTHSCMCTVILWFYVVWGILSRLYLFYTAVWYQSLIAFCLCSFVMSICILCSCVLSTFDCMLYVCCCMFICIQYNCVLSTFVCVFLLICNLYNEFYVLMLIIILYNISLVLSHLL